MKSTLGLLVAGLLATSTLYAAAQTVVITPEQRTVITEYVHKKPLASISVPGIELNIGSTLPETVEIQKIDVPEVKYSYVVVDNKTVVVDADRRIVDVW